MNILLALTAFPPCSCLADDYTNASLSSLKSSPVFELQEDCDLCYIQ